MEHPTKQQQSDLADIVLQAVEAIRTQLHIIDTVHDMLGTGLFSTEVEAIEQAATTITTEARYTLKHE